MSNNEAAGGELMTADITKAAMDAIKEELDGQDEYEELGLPETKELGKRTKGVGSRTANVGKKHFDVG